VQNSPGEVEIPRLWAEEFLTRPGMVATILIYIAGLIPLVEELLKPMVLWFVLHRKPDPKDGFLIGAAAGAGYAMFENLTIGASLEDWAFITVSRLGTAAIHVLASGLVGWGMASAASEKRYIRLIGAYLAAVFLHAVWNGLNIITALGEFSVFQSRVSPFISSFASFGPAGLVLLALGSILGLIRANNYFRRAIIAQDSDN
jgi:RsiW-degrading membrane proteinase PrsW (M82 family)